jgi:hypothetical protein
VFYRHFIAAAAATMGIAGAANATLVTFNRTFTNNTAQARTYDVMQSIDMAGAVLDPTMGGSVAAILIDMNGDGATLSSLGTTAIYTALIQNTAVQTLLPGDWAFQVNPFMSDASTPASFSNVVLPSGSASGTMSIRLQFTLSAGDKVSFSSNFVVQAVPAPGALGLAALAGVGCRGRRRRA